MTTVSSHIQQAAAIPYWAGRVCLVSSRSGKRWVIPKGCLEPNRTLKQIAIQEAWEEAGLVGFLDDQPVGCYLYEKAGDIYHVTVYVMQVTEMADDWPEAGQRRRIWVAEHTAHKHVAPAGLRNILRKAKRMICAAL
jgi:8-oxo-dGTP pyrophosphatase MutT (NUDIX family)